MTKDLFIDMCIKAARIQGRCFRFSDVPWQEDELIYYDGAAYVPISLIISFDRDCNAIYTARLRDVKANYSIIETKLSDLTVAGGFKNEMQDTKNKDS